MGVLSEGYIMQLLGNYAASEAGKKKIASAYKKAFKNNKSIRGGLSKKEVKKILAEISGKFVKAVAAVIQSFRSDGVHAVMGEMDNEGQVHASIAVDEEALRRESLHYVNKEAKVAHGEGVNDILALFTHGYTITSKRPYGFWVRDPKTTGDSLVRIGALMHRDPNPFLTKFVEEISAEYSGKCKVTLNDKYKGGG